MAPRPALRVVAVVGVCLLSVFVLTCGSPPAVTDGGMNMCTATQCGAACVDTTTDVHHCGGCNTDCAALPNVEPSGVACQGGACVVTGACRPGFAHCSSNPADGCEVDLGSASHCGACGNACAEPTPTCSPDGDGGAACTTGCSGATPDRCDMRCVDLSTDPGFCGACTTACPAPQNGAAACDAGACDISCDPGFHACGPTCASNSSPATCGGSCTPCTVPANAQATCDGGACGFACDPAFANCDGDPANGCEADTRTDVTACGACGVTCSAANGTAFCDAGTCDVSTCGAGFANCDSDPANGCEVNTNTSAANCGACGTVCTAANGTGACDAGACDVGGCNPGFGNCDGNPANGCEEDTTTSNANCGACGTPCAPANGTGACVASACTVTGCTTGFANCDGDPANGCEVNTNTSAANCGACGTVCTTANGTAACVAGACAVGSCDPGFADCDNDPSNGCEVDTTTSTANCGACGTACAPANGTGACVASACTLTSCNAGFADCDNTLANGCEVNTNTSANNCGACGTVCSVANGTPACSNGTCAVGSCDPGFADCDNNPANGCEVNTNTSAADCGACGNVCNVANGSPACTGGACTVATCNAGFSDCDGNPANGCEVNLASSANNCGGCGNICNVANGTAACVSGMCGVAACNAGFADCDGNPANGCEVNVGADANNCGGCGNICTVANGTAACAAGTCAVAACNAGFANCNNQAADGCEVNTTNNPGSCGACGNVCNVPNGTAACASSTCIVAACNAGFANCNGLSGDGCEVNTNADNGNCGACGNNCAASCTGNVTATTCSAGSCAITACTAGRYNIDGVCSNGCECQTSGTSTSCSAPSSLGTVNLGQTVTYSGNLVPTGQEAYVAVTFTGNTSSSYHPRVRFTANPGNAFAFDVLSNCSGSAIACGVEGGNSVNRTDWETFWPGPAPGYLNPIPPVGNAGTVIIHVYRKAGQPVSCANYTLTVSN